MAASAIRLLACREVLVAGSCSALSGFSAKGTEDWGMLGHIAGSGVGGNILMIITGFIKNSRF